MSKFKTLRKKGLALILCLMMGVAALSGCEKNGGSGAEEQNSENEIEVPEVKGKEKTVGAFTLLVPKGMDAEEGDSESEVILTDEDDNTIILQVFDKKEAKNHIKELQEENEKLKEESFDLNGVSWSGVSSKKTFSVYGKVGSQTVLATGEGFKLMDDIPLAVLASLEVDGDAEPLSGGGSSSKGGTLEVYGGIYSVEYSNVFEKTEYDTLETPDGSAEIYLTCLMTADSLYDTLETFDDYDCTEISTADGMTGYLYSNDFGKFFMVPFKNYYESDYWKVCGIEIMMYGDDFGPEVEDAFEEMCKSVRVGSQYCTDEVVEAEKSGWQKYWEQGWYGWYIIYDGDGKYKDDITWSYDCLATFEVESSNTVRFTMTQDDVDDIMADVEFTHYNDSTESGYLVADGGKFWLADCDGDHKLNNWMELEVDSMDFMIDPEADSELLDDYITFTITFVDDDKDTVTVKGFFRPWGTDWNDVYDVDGEDLPEIVKGRGPSSYEGMLPYKYSEWYEDRMNDEFPGIWGMLE